MFNKEKIALMSTKELLDLLKLSCDLFYPPYCEIEFREELSDLKMYVLEILKERFINEF